MVKQLLLPALVIFLLQTATAQNPATPNAGFENWTQVSNYWNPTGWNNLNPSTYILGVFTCSRATAAGDVHSGTYAIKLTTKSVFGITANGIASTATLITAPPYGVTGGLPYTQRPDSIVGWYKYTPASAADSGFVQFVLLDAANDTIGFVKFHTPNSPVSTYTRFSKEITYFSPASPTNSYWILSSSDGVNPVVNSSIIIDDINLVFNSSGINDPVEESMVHVSNSLIAQELFVENNSSGKMNLTIIDATGRKVADFIAQAGHNRFDLQHFKRGIYFYFFTDESPAIISSGKLLKM